MTVSENFSSQFSEKTNSEIEQKTQPTQTKFQTKFQEKFLFSFWPKLSLILPYILFLGALVVAFITRFVFVFNYNQFDGDQSRDAFIYMQMREGNFPLLGPSSSVGGYGLLPLYYYIIWPFSLLGPDPVFQALGNTFFSFCSVFLLGLLIYRLFTHLSHQNRLILASLASFWYAWFKVDIYSANTEWNPNPTVFFLILFVLTWQKLWQNNFQTKKAKYFFWASFGLLTSILASLHSSTMLVMGLVFVLCLLFFACLKKDFRFPLVSIFASLFALLPYWLGEFQTGFYNSQKMFQVLILDPKEAHTFLEKLDRGIFSLLEIARLGYFPHPSLSNFSQFFVSLLLGLFLLKMKDKLSRPIIYLLGLIWLVFTAACASYFGVLHAHYITLFWPLPLILAISLLGLLDWKKPLEIGLAGFILFGMVLSLFTNILKVTQIARGKYGADRVLNTKDMQKALSSLPDLARVCTNKERIEQYQYLDKYIIKKNLIFSEDCAQSQFWIFQKFSIDGDLIISHEANSDKSIFQENEAYKIFKMD